MVFLNVPAIAIYYYIYMTIIDKNNENHYQNLKHQIIKNGDLFPKIEIRDIYLMAINYCIGQFNIGRQDFIKESFDLMKKGFEEEFLIENGRISRFTFLNFVTIGLKLEEYLWIDSFINNYQKYLDPKHRESIIHYSKAKLFFEKRRL